MEKNIRDNFRNTTNPTILSPIKLKRSYKNYVKGLE